MTDRNCARCGQLKPIDDFYYVSKKLGTRRGQCKDCMAEVKAAQRDPNWKPACCKCGKERPRAGPGRRLCGDCFHTVYDGDAKRVRRGSHYLKLNPCSACGSDRVREDHVKGSSLCPICRSVPQGRRTKLRTLYNMTPREYLNLLDAQNYRCAICSAGFTKRRLANIDHRHKDPPILRGILCTTCNGLLGMAKDRADMLHRASEYLYNPPAQELMPERVATPKANESRGGYRPLRRTRH